ncbi:ricin-type beta-trefoil lectin protein [Chitinophaga niastensis]|uniref:Ricin-type beta-trefoil lectin protein n=1 Tax=Chitinophaga niastensis TaxID=536980 RepID=A0A2P8H9H7_CHINA|nr:RICIN domain-containing protein [Chitinophaga niastensis]PSL42887.1 ricin-type beta-trefoil lectin protein [Chitinophaga niastensis]
MKKNNFTRLAATTMGLASVMLSCKKDQTVANESAAKTVMQTVKSDSMVLTPYGMIPSSRVFEVDNNATVKIVNGHLQKLQVSTGKVLQDFGQLSEEALHATNPYAYAARFSGAANARKASTTAVNSSALASGGTNYPGYTVQAAASNIKSFSTKWIVPDVPQESTSTATTFLWNGIDGGALQPVLMWGGTAGGAFYAIANWYFLGGNYFHGQYVNVSPGTQLQGVITYISYDGTNWVYKESFTGYPAADVTVTRPTEATGVIECWEAYTNIVTQWPKNLYTAMNNINLTVRSGTPPATFNWSVSGGAITTPSGNNTVIVSNSTSNGEIDFYFDGSNPSTGIVSGATYKIVSATNNSSVLDVTGGGTTDGTKVELWSNNSPTSTNQEWVVTSIGNGYYKVQPLNAPSKALDVSGGGSADGTQIDILTYSGSSAQQWNITSVGGGYYNLTPACATSSSLDIYSNNTANGTKVEIWGSNGSNAQKFKFVMQ